MLPNFAGGVSREVGLEQCRGAASALTGHSPGLFSIQGHHRVVPELPVHPDPQSCIQTTTAGPLVYTSPCVLGWGCNKTGRKWRSLPHVTHGQGRTPFIHPPTSKHALEHDTPWAREVFGVKVKGTFSSLEFPTWSWRQTRSRGGMKSHMFKDRGTPSVRSLSKAGPSVLRKETGKE